MAMDVALARCLPEGEGVLRIYRWCRPTLSLGRNQPARGRYDPLAGERMGAEVVRRPTGGREVMHDRELTFSVHLPARALGGVREAQRTVSRALLAALRSLGVDAEAAEPGTRVPGLDGESCFATAAPGEITVRGRKLVGSAQARVGRVLLQHGSLVLAPPSVTLSSLREPAPSLECSAERTERAEARAWRGAVDPRGSTPSAPGSPRHPGFVGGGDPGITLAEILPRPIGFGEVAGAVEAALAGAFGGSWVRGETAPEEDEVAGALLHRYESSSWTWRR